MIKREANFTIYFRHWLKANTFMASSAFELKQTTTDSLPFSSVKQHQINALLAVKNAESGVLYKAPDDSMGSKPFDLFYLRLAEAYIVVKYPKLFVIIDIEDFLHEMQISKRKSLISSRAKVICCKWHQIK